MTTIFNLRAATNATFRWTRDLSNLAKVYDIASSTIRMQARLTALADDPPIYEWCSHNASGGLASFDPATGLCVFSAPAADMARMPAGLIYDCLLELIGGAIVPLFSGRMAFTRGVTRSALDASETGGSRIDDTVVVDGEVFGGPSASPATTMASHFAADAAAQAMAAAQSATAASDSATAASQSAIASSQSATAAGQSATLAAQSATAASDSAAVAIASAQVASAGATSLTPSALVASFVSLSQSERAALAQLLFAALPDMSSGSVSVASGQAFVDASGFFVRAE